MVMFLVFLSLLSLLTQHSSSATTIIVDGVTKWNIPIVHVGDSIIFRHKYKYNLYIFQNQNAFNLCNFTRATLLTKYNSSSYTWHPSRPGFYFFTFNKNNYKMITSCIQLDSSSQRLSIQVIPTNTTTTSPPLQSPIPSPITGGVVPSSPAFPWPFRPREVATTPMQAPVPSPDGNAMPSSTDNGVNGMPFINSNPAVPLPTGEIDSATIRPLPTSGAHQHRQVALGLLCVHMTMLCVTLVTL